MPAPFNTITAQLRHSQTTSPFTLAWEPPAPAPYLVTPWGDVWTTVLNPLAGVQALDGLGPPRSSAAAGEDGFLVAVLEPHGDQPPAARRRDAPLPGVLDRHRALPGAGVGHDQQPAGRYDPLSVLQGGLLGADRRAAPRGVLASNRSSPGGLRSGALRLGPARPRAQAARRGGRRPAAGSNPRDAEALAGARPPLSRQRRARARRGGLRAGARASRRATRKTIYFLGLIREEARRHRRALASLLAARSRDRARPTPRSATTSAASCSTPARPAEAVVELPARRSGSIPSEPAFRVGLARALRQSGSLEEALAAVQGALRVAPDHPAAQPGRRAHAEGARARTPPRTSPRARALSRRRRARSLVP